MFLLQTSGVEFYQNMPFTPTIQPSPTDGKRCWAPRYFRHFPCTSQQLSAEATPTVVPFRQPFRMKASAISGALLRLQFFSKRNFGSFCASAHEDG